MTQAYPTWDSPQRVPPSFTNVDDGNPMFEPEPWSNDGGVRVGEFGLLDFLQNVTDSLSEWVRHAENEGLHRYPDRKPQLKPLTTRPKAADNWGAKTYVIGTDHRMILPPASKRRSLTVVNWGAGILFLSDVSGNGSGTTPSASEVQVPASSATLWAPRKICTTAGVWMRASAATITIDIVEEYDMEESDK